MRRKPAGQLTRAITHIALTDGHRGKLAELYRVWVVYRPLCEQYIAYFCTEATPDATIDFVYGSTLSGRWQRVAVQQAAGIAQSWRSNRANHWADYQGRLQAYERLEEAQRARRKAPVWTEPRRPQLQALSIQANRNVVQPMDEKAAVLALEPAERVVFDLWLRVSTLDKGQPIYVPVRLSAYHKQALGSLTPNTSVTLNQRKGRWWLTLTVTHPYPVIDPAQARGTTGADIGIRNYITDGYGRHYGSFTDNLLAAHERDQAKRQRKAKLRACLEKKGVLKLPSTTSASGQRLARRTRQDINFAVNRFLDDHVNDVVAVESLSISAMRFKSRRMNGVLRASNLAHIPRHLKWSAAKRGIPIVSVQAAYSSQECPRCHFTARANRPNQQTFCCQVCGYADHADVVAARNLESRLNDAPLAACRGLTPIKHLLDCRHADWRTQNGYP